MTSLCTGFAPLPNMLPVQTQRHPMDFPQNPSFSVSAFLSPAGHSHAGSGSPAATHKRSVPAQTLCNRPDFPALPASRFHPADAGSGAALNLLCIALGNPAVDGIQLCIVAITAAHPGVKEITAASGQPSFLVGPVECQSGTGQFFVSIFINFGDKKRSFLISSTRYSWTPPVSFTVTRTAFARANPGGTSVSTST